jgi:L-alanine-DL-glutamate epimerase-like enolase superfamily enzyme
VRVVPPARKGNAHAFGTIDAREPVMTIDRRGFAKSLAGVVGGVVTTSRERVTSQAPSAATQARPVRLPPAKITRIRVFYPPNYDRNNAQAFPQSNMVVLVDTDAGLTGVGQGGSPDTVRNVARSVIGKNAFDTEMIWQAAFMDGFYSPGKERLHAIGAIDLALWDIKGKALNAPLYQLFGGKAREHIELYATLGLPPGVVPAAEAAAMGLKERAAATMAAGYRVYRVDGGIVPTTDRPAGGGPPPELTLRGGVFDSRARIPQIIKALEQIREGVGPDGNWMIDVHQKFDFHEAVELCRLMEPLRPFCVEDPLREEQFRTQLPKLRMMTTVPLAPGEEWGTRADFSPLVEQRDIDFARVSLPNVGGITEMLKIMAVCDTHKVGIVPHFTGPIATAGHMHTMMAFPGQVLMEYNLGERQVPYMPEFLECRNGKVWPNDRPGLGVSVDERQLTFVEAMTEGAPAPTHRRPDGSLTHW